VVDGSWMRRERSESVRGCAAVEEFKRKARGTCLAARINSAEGAIDYSGQELAGFGAGTPASKQ
jgi:hypothetical protein